jgi:hypothetical protein
MKYLLLLLLAVFALPSGFCQKFIVRDDSLIVNRDTSAVYNKCGDSIRIDVNWDNITDFVITYTCPVETCCQDVGYQNCNTNQSFYTTIVSNENFEIDTKESMWSVGFYNYQDTISTSEGHWQKTGWLESRFYGGPGCSIYQLGWGVGTGYVFYRNQNNGDPVYGWINIRISGFEFQVYGYGIQDKHIASIRNNPLIDIEISVSSSEILLSNIRVPVTVSLIDVNGRVLSRQNCNADEAINIENLKPGFYLLRISNSKSQITKKIIK